MPAGLTLNLNSPPLLKRRIRILKSHAFNPRIIQPVKSTSKTPSRPFDLGQIPFC